MVRERLGEAAARGRGEQRGVEAALLANEGGQQGGVDPADPPWAMMAAGTGRGRAAAGSPAGWSARGTRAGRAGAQGLGHGDGARDIPPAGEQQAAGEGERRIGEREEIAHRRRPLVPDAEGEQHLLRPGERLVPQRPAPHRHLGQPQEGSGAAVGEQDLLQPALGRPPRPSRVAAEQQPGAVEVVDAARGGQPAALGGGDAGERLAGEPRPGRAGERVIGVGAQDVQIPGHRLRAVLLQLRQPAAPVVDLQAVVAAAQARLRQPGPDALAPAADEIRGGEEEGRPRRFGPPLGPLPVSFS